MRRRRSRVAHPSSALVSTSNAGAFAGRTAIPALPVRCSSRLSSGRSRSGSTSSQPTRRTWSRSSPPTETTSSAGPAVASSSPSGTTVPRTGWDRCSTTSAGSTTRPASSSPRSTHSSGALAARERDPANGDGLALARYGVGKTLRAVGRADDAIPLLEHAVEWASSESGPDGWFHEELAEAYAAVGRTDDAHAQARLAIPLLERDDPSFAEDAGRTARLDDLARG